MLRTPRERLAAEVYPQLLGFSQSGALLGPGAVSSRSSLRDKPCSAVSAIQSLAPQCWPALLAASLLKCVARVEDKVSRPHLSAGQDDDFGADIVISCWFWARGIRKHTFLHNPEPQTDALSCILSCAKCCAGDNKRQKVCRAKRVIT